jgi:hypothetical protein
MLELNQMLPKLLFEQQAEWKEDRTRLLTELYHSPTIDSPENRGNQSKMFKMVDPLRYCGGVKKLDTFLETFWSNFASHKLLFSRGNPDQVWYAVSFLDSWNNHPDMTQRQTENTDPAKWARDLRAAKDP